MKKLIATSLLTLAVFSAQAEFVKMDLVNTGDNLITLDTETNLEWLNLSYTAGISFSSINADVNADRYDGFRVATQSEVFGIIDTFFPGTFLESQGGIMRVVDETQGDAWKATFGLYYSNSNNRHFSYGRHFGRVDAQGVLDTREHLSGINSEEEYWFNYRQAFNRCRDATFLVRDFSGVGDLSNITRVNEAPSSCLSSTDGSFSDGSEFQVPSSGGNTGTSSSDVSSSSVSLGLFSIALSMLLFSRRKSKHSY